MSTNITSTDVEVLNNQYGTTLKLAPNLLFAILMIIILIWQIFMLYKSRQWWFGVCFFCGSGMEFAGYVARSIAVYDLDNSNIFICQIVCLTIAPAFIMGGIYYLLGQIIIIFGEKYSLLKPLWYSYIFIACDVISILIQAAGGGVAAGASDDGKSSKPGTHIMVGGIAFQIVSMSFFLGFLTYFLYMTFFRSNPEQGKFSIKRLFNYIIWPQNKEKLFDIDHHFVPSYSGIRARSLFRWFPIVIFLSVILIYIRCIYRVVELSQGWTGYLITHEVFLFTLDALMVFLCLALYTPFHPGLVFGLAFRLDTKTMRKRRDNDNDGDIESNKETSNQQGTEPPPIFERENDNHSPNVGEEFMSSKDSVHYSSL